MLNYSVAELRLNSKFQIIFGVGKPSNCLRSSIINVFEEESEASVKYKKHVYFNLDVLPRMFYNDYLW